MNRLPLPLPGGTIVCVCEPQSVLTVLIWCGSSGSLMSKIRTPSQAFGLDAVVPVELQLTSDRGASTDTNSRSPHTDTSNWLPGHRSNATCVAFAGSEMSITRSPSYVQAYAY